MPSLVCLFGLIFLVILALIAIPILIIVAKLMGVVIIGGLIALIGRLETFRSCGTTLQALLINCMCGRYVRGDKQKIAEHFAIRGSEIPDFQPSWNVAPQTFQPVIRLNRGTGEREIVMMRWGLVPYWAKEPSIGLRTINAKAETITTAPAFREAIKYRRCLVPADAFYEWQKLDAKTKRPFAIALRSNEP
jgi:hypothetical protein